MPCCLALEQKGYVVEVIRCFQADNPVEPLGLVSMVELRRPDWRASDMDIDAFLGKYGGQATQDDAPHAAVVCSHHDDQFRH